MEAAAWAWRGWVSWRAAAVLLSAWLALHVAARVADALWWRPRRLEAHFAAQGVRGPPYRFLLGSVKEMVGLMVEASSKPMSPPTSHNALPRVLAFYHYWRKIYGASLLAAAHAYIHTHIRMLCARIVSQPASLRGLIAHLFGRFWLHLLVDLLSPCPNFCLAHLSLSLRVCL